MEEEITKKLQATYTNSLYRFGPLVSVCYTAANLYTFAWILNMWNDFSPLMIAYSAVHLIVPIYTFILSLDQYLSVQTIVYYFASTVKSIANGIIFLETCVLMLALFTQSLTENTSFAIRAGNLITNMGIIMVPFVVMTGFLYYEVSQFRKEHSP